MGGFTNAWQNRTGGVEFHAAHCDSDQGVFANTSHKENKDLYKDLTKLLAASKLLGYGVAIDLASQNKYLPGILPESPYYKCFGEVIVYFAWQAHLAVPRDHIRFTFHRRLETNYNATWLYDYLSQLPEWDYHRYLHDEVGFASQALPEIQASDLWAREVMKQLDNRIGPVKRPPRLSYEALRNTGRFGVRNYIGEWFQGLATEVTRLHSEGKGAFNVGKYNQWLSQNGLTDTYRHRLRFVMQWDMLQRASGNPAHFDDVRLWNR